MGRSEFSVVRDGFHVTVDGVPVRFAARAVSVRLRPGAGGLPTLYWTGDLRTALAPGAHVVAVSDGVYGDPRIGWKDIVVGNAAEPTKNLTHYPSALIGSPRRVAAVRFDLSQAGFTSAIVSSEDPIPDINGSSSIVRSNALTDMFSNPNRAPLFILLTALVAFGLGALHAIEPGHGKALLAFTLVGSRATVKQAMILAASLTFAHTAGVFVLGIVLFFVAGFAAESIYPWITLVSGVAIAFIGARNLARYLHGKLQHDHAHVHDFVDDHHHGHGESGHSHAIPGDGKIDFRAAIVAAMSGGIAPCPAAIVVMLAALRLHQMGYGLFLIVIFRLGLATVLTALGLAVVHGSAWVTRSRPFDQLVSAGPLISATLISIVGAVMLAQGFVAAGVRSSVWLLGGLSLLAVAGYVVSAQHSHSSSDLRR